MTIILKALDEQNRTLAHIELDDMTEWPKILMQFSAMVGMPIESVVFRASPNWITMRESNG